MPKNTSNTLLKGPDKPKRKYNTRYIEKYLNFSLVRSKVRLYDKCGTKNANYIEIKRHVLYGSTVIV